jgi:hypothetical protein
MVGGKRVKDMGKKELVLGEDAPPPPPKESPKR